MSRGVYDRSIFQRLHICAVYSILNTVTGEMYIGSSKDVAGRIGRHYLFLSRGTHGNKKLSEAVFKYGLEKFAFIILEETTPELQFQQETVWLHQEMPEYNSAYEDARTTRGLRPSIGTRLKMSSSHMGNKVGVGNQNRLGKKHTTLTKEYMSRARKEYWARKHGELI